MKRIIIGLVVAAIWACTSSAQTPVNSNSVNVRNNAPADVWFTFPSVTNVHEIQFGCSNSPIFANTVWVYEEVNNQPVAYERSATIVCNEDGDSFSLTGDITVTTPDHTITIRQSTNWEVVYTFRRGWFATGGSSQIVVQ